jgi:hypothetical protein
MNAIRIRRTWSIAGLLIGVALAALVFKAARSVVVRPVRPVSVIPLEIDINWPGTIASKDLAIQDGPDWYSVLAVARNDHDGSVRVEDGRGRPVTAKLIRALPPADPIVTRAAPWIDVADVILAADPATLADVNCQVLAHKGRKFFHCPGLGVVYLPGNPPRVRLLSLGAALPETVDLWIDATRSPRRGTPVVRLEAKPGATVRVGPATFTIREIKRRRFGEPRFKARGALVHPDLGDLGAISVILNAWSDSQGDLYNSIMGPDMRPGYELCAVGRDGRRVYAEHHPIQSLPPRPSAKWNIGDGMLVFGIDREELSHFEAWPGLGWTRLYFDGVKLPRSVGRPFDPGPVVRIEVGGREIETSVPEFAPIPVTVRLRPGRIADPLMPSEPAPIFGEFTDRDTTFTAALDIKNLFGHPWTLTFLDRDGRRLDAKFGASPSNPHDASGHGMRRQTAWYNLPLDRVGAVEVSPP